MRAGREATYSEGTPLAATIDLCLDFRRELRAALRERSPSALRAVLESRTDPDDAELRRLASLSDEALARLIRCLTLADPRLADLHASARLWLAHHEPLSDGPGAGKVVPIGGSRREPAVSWLPYDASAPA
jgi:transposase